MGSAASSHPSSLATVLAEKAKKEERMKRRAVHAGSWYESTKDDLDATLSKFLFDAETTLKQKQEENDKEQSNHPSGGNAYTVDSEKLVDGIPRKSSSKGTGLPRAIVAPHAGYSYSGATAAYAYAALREAVESKSNSIRHILVLHPSHHIRLDGCAISATNVLVTPLGDLAVDSDLRSELLQSGRFCMMNRRDDENEHSGEMQYPYIYKVLSDCQKENIPVLPIMVGNISSAQADIYGQILAPMLARPDVFTIISSDFCHWGTRFQYSPFEKSDKTNEIFQYIQWLDNLGMEQISMQDPGAFTIYLKKYRNTICGRFPIVVWLNAVRHNKEQRVQTLDIQFVRYAQSSQIYNESESSVSYASGVARLSTVTCGPE